MVTMSYFIGPVVALLLLAAVVWALMTRRLRERHALWWVIGAVVALVVSLFPSLLESASAALGIEVPLNLAFVFAIALIFLVSLQHSAELTSLEEKVRTLAEHVAELEMRRPSTAASPDSAEVER